MSRRIPRLRPLLTVALCVLCACGPELSDPGTSDLTGIWQGQQAIGVVDDIELELIHEEGGALRGAWSGTITRPPGACPPDLGTPLRSILYGTANVITVEFQMLGIGQYVGALVSPTKLTGRLDSCSRSYPLDFELVTREIPR